MQDSLGASFSWLQGMKPVVPPPPAGWLRKDMPLHRNSFAPEVGQGRVIVEGQ